METDPIKPSKTESHSSDTKEDSKKTKKAGRLGAAAMEAGSRADETPGKPAEKEPEQKRSSLWERLTRSDKQKVPEIAEITDTGPDKPEKPEEAEKAEKDIPLEHLSRTEKQAAIAELAHNRRAELTDEPEGAQSEQDEAASRFLASTEELGDSDAAFQEIVHELGLEPGGPSGGELPLHEDADVLVMEREDNKLEAEPDDGVGGGAIPPRRPPGGGHEAEPDDPVEPDDDPAQQAHYQAAYGRAAAGVTPIANAPSTPNSPSGPTENNYYYERRAQQRGLIVGAVVGYFIGRRRGRINAEKRLLPVQKKLEKEVKSLQSDILQKEIIIRKKTAEKRKAPLSAPTERLIATVSEAAKPSVTETAKPEPKLSPMHIGHALLIGQNNMNRAPVPQAAIELIPLEQKTIEHAAIEKQQALMPEKSVEKQVLTMSRQELLKTSEKVIIEGATLRQIYETNLVNEPELRRIVTEYVRGGDVKKALRVELKDNGVSYERDPALRKLFDGGGIAGSGKTAVHDAVQTPEIAALLASKQESDIPSSQAALPKAPEPPRKPVRPLLVTAVVIIVILMALYLGHRT